MKPNYEFDYATVTAGALQKYRRGHLRYEFLRTLNPRQFEELWEKCLKGGVRFDDEVDWMRKERDSDQYQTP